ncbi:DUF397 domain-containing protein [Kitasatospora sp. NPDC002543]
MNRGRPATRRTSTHSTDGGRRIEVDDAHPGRVRDSKDPGGPRLDFSPAARQSLVTAIHGGELGTA